MVDIILLFVFVLVALTLSFLCSIAEAVLLSITPSYIEGLRDKRPKQAEQLTRLKQDKLDRSLAAILTLNTVAHTVGAILAGAKAAVVFGNSWFGVFSAVMTLLILFLSEIVPKTIGAVYWPNLVGPTALFVKILIYGLFPFVWLSEILTRIVSRGKKVSIFPREELLAMARLGEKHGFVSENESKIVQNLLRFDELTASDIMTPRTVISALPESETVENVTHFVHKQPFSRLPVYDKTIDEITGFVHKYDILLAKARMKTGDVIGTLKRGIIAVPETASLSVLLGNLLKDSHHIAIVVNEYGGTEGLVTMEDLVETLMGVEIMDEKDKVEDMRALARKRWRDRAMQYGIEDKPADPSE